MDDGEVIALLRLAKEEIEFLAWLNHLSVDESDSTPVPELLKNDDKYQIIMSALTRIEKQYEASDEPKVETVSR